MYAYTYPFLFFKRHIREPKCARCCVTKKLIYKTWQTKAQEWNANLVFRAETQYQGQNSSGCSSALIPKSVSCHLESIPIRTNTDAAPIICWELCVLNDFYASFHSILSTAL